MKLDFKYITLLIVLLLWLGVSIYFFTYFKTECEQSKENPYVYAATRSNAVECSCLLSNGNTLKFDQKRAWIPITYKGPEINYTALYIDLDFIKDENATIMAEEDIKNYKEVEK